MVEMRLNGPTIPYTWPTCKNLKGRVPIKCTSTIRLTSHKDASGQHDMYYVDVSKCIVVVV